jgi:hypothetical protein
VLPLLLNIINNHNIVIVQRQQQEVQEVVHQLRLVVDQVLPKRLSKSVLNVSSNVNMTNNELHLVINQTTITMQIRHQLIMMVWMKPQFLKYQQRM